MEKLFRQIGCLNGTAFLQAIRKENKVYFLELGYRLDGIGAWKRNKMEGKYSSVDFLVDFAAGRQKTESICREGTNGKPGGTYLLWAHPGRIGKIEGVRNVKRMEAVEIIIERFQEGDVIPDEVSMHQVAFGICIVAENKEGLKEQVRKINHLLHIYDEEGKDMLYYLTDYESLE